MGSLYFLLNFAVTLKTVPKYIQSTKERSGNISRLEEMTETWQHVILHWTEFFFFYKEHFSGNWGKISRVCGLDNYLIRDNVSI